MPYFTHTEDNTQECNDDVIHFLNDWGHISFNIKNSLVLAIQLQMLLVKIHISQKARFNSVLPLHAYFIHPKDSTHECNGDAYTCVHFLNDWGHISFNIQNSLVLAIHLKMLL